MEGSMLAEMQKHKQVCRNARTVADFQKMKAMQILMECKAIENLLECKGSGRLG